MPEINQAWLALIGALLGGSGLKVIEHWLNRSKSKDNTATDFRNELRTDIKDLRAELAKTEAELDQWRVKYYALMDEFIKFKLGKNGSS